MISVQNITYIHQNKDTLFENINFSCKDSEKVALIGNNGTGKSTLLKIIAGVLEPSNGKVICSSKPYYVPQHFGQYNDCTIAAALQIEKKLDALKSILDGNFSEEKQKILGDDWTIEERCNEALSFWGLQNFPLTQEMNKLSGGEKTKVFLAGILIHKPDIVLLDEPTNHLDLHSREILYNYVQNCTQTLIVVSHDRTLLQQLNTVYELDSRGITVYGGNYEFYKEQKDIEGNAVLQKLRNAESSLRKAKMTEQETLERKLRSDIRGKKKLKDGGMPHAMKKLLKNKAEASTSRLQEVHKEKLAEISDEVSQMKQKAASYDKMRMNFESSNLHQGKILVNAENINFAYKENNLWANSMNIQIRSGERLNIKGANGSGKTTLIKIILGQLEPTSGEIKRAEVKSVYIDQEYSLIDNTLTVYEQAQRYNYEHLQEHEIKIRLFRFLFNSDFWDKPCGALSGGEKMRLLLCCLMISNKAPDLFILDEPTNNLDIQNIEILTSAINEYHGTLIVVSHDKYFLEEIRVDGEIKVG